MMKFHQSFVAKMEASPSSYYIIYIKLVYKMLFGVIVIVLFGVIGNIYL
jgi:hypothetical protein